MYRGGWALYESLCGIEGSMTDLPTRLSRALTDGAEGCPPADRDGWTEIQRRIAKRTVATRRRAPLLAAAAVLAVGFALGIGIVLHPIHPVGVAASGSTDRIVAVAGPAAPPVCGARVQIAGWTRGSQGYLAINDPRAPGATRLCLTDGLGWYYNADPPAPAGQVHLTVTHQVRVLWGSIAAGADQVRIVLDRGTYVLGHSSSGPAMNASFVPGTDGNAGMFFLYPTTGFGQPSAITVQALRAGTVIATYTLSG